MLVLLVSGCGNGGGETPFSSTTNTSFSLESVDYRVFLPDGWRIVSEPKAKGKLFLAEKYSANIVILPGGKYTEDVQQQLIDDAQKTLPGFTLLSESKNKLEYETQNATEKRQYYQKMVVFGESFLLGSCSYRNQAFEDECEQILDSISQE